MIDLRLTQKENNLLSCLLHHESVSIIWDINAFYINTSNDTYKLECFDKHPEGSDYRYDEIFFCKFEKLATRLSFSNTENDYWYKIISTNTKIYSLEIIEIAQAFPGGNLIDISSAVDNGSNLISLGLLIGTDLGILPAFLLPSNHGFTWHDKYDFYDYEEVEALLDLNIKLYNRKPVDFN